MCRNTEIRRNSVAKLLPVQIGKHTDALKEEKKRMNYVKYNRSFVMMEEQSSQFAARGSLPVKGYLKVETGNNKGALRCVVQNLRYYEKGDYIYKLILFGKKGERTIHTVIGDLLVNRQGNGETYFRFLPLDVDGKGNSYHQYTTAIIAAASMRDDREPLHPVLKGVTVSDEEPFRSELVPIDEETEDGQNRDIDEIISKISELIEEDEIDVIVQEAEPEEQENSMGEQETPMEEQAAVPEEKERTVSKRTYNNFYNEYILNACAHTCRSAEFYEDVAPFDNDRTGARWKKIVNITSLPLVSPGAHYFATQYRHYIFGAKPDEKGMATKFFFGIPGRFRDEEQPDGGKSGFTYWQAIRGADPVFENYRKAENGDRNSYGYWIVSVDGKTGNIEEI